MAQHDDASQQAQAAQAGYGERHSRALPRVRAMRPEPDQQERRQAGQFPEHDEQDQVVGEHDTQHGAHERQQVREETRRRIVGRKVIARIQHDQRADGANDERERPREPVHPEPESHVGEPWN